MGATNTVQVPTSAFTTGFALSATLIVAIGAQNAFVLRQGLRREHVAAIVAFCAVADLALIAIGVAGLAKITSHAPLLAMVLTVAGTLFLVWYGLLALRRAFRRQTLQAAGGAHASWRTAVGQAAAFTFLNPHVYLDTVLLMGTIGARQPADSRLWFVGGAALASGLWFTGLGFGARILRPLFSRPRAWQVLDLLVGATMLGLAAGLVHQAWSKCC